MLFKSTCRLNFYEIEKSKTIKECLDADYEKFSNEAEKKKGKKKRSWVMRLQDGQMSLEP